MVRKKNFLIWKILHFLKPDVKREIIFYNVLFYELPGSIVCVNVMNRWESVGLQTMGQTSHTWTSTKLSVSPMEGADQGWDPLECKRKSLVKVYFFVRQVLTKKLSVALWFTIILLIMIDVYCYRYFDSGTCWSLNLFNLYEESLTLHTFTSKFKWVCIYHNPNLVTLQEETSSPVPTHAPCHSSLWNHRTGGQVFRSGVSCPVWLQRHPADLVGLHKDDGSQGSETRLWGGYSQC